MDQYHSQYWPPRSVPDAQAPTPILHPQFKAQVVLEVLAGLKSQAEVARQHKLKPELIARWKDIALEGLESLFQSDDRRGRDQDRIADLERMVGRLTMELEVEKTRADFKCLREQVTGRLRGLATRRSTDGTRSVTAGTIFGG